MMTSMKGLVVRQWGGEEKWCFVCVSSSADADINVGWGMRTVNAGGGVESRQEQATFL